MTFRYNRTPTGELPGNSLITQTEAALSALSGEATEAKEAAQAAQTAAEDAASQAGAAASSAAASAAAAESAAQSAAVAQQALTVANRAETTAQQAVTTATAAADAAQSAQTAAEDAASDAQDAADLAAQSAQDAQTAQGAASASQTAAESAQTSAGQAATVATQAQQAAAASAQSAAESEAAVGASARQIGEIVTSTLPIYSAGIHLLDGALIDGSGIYADFVSYIAGLYENDPTAAYFTDETSWQSSVTQYGVSGKFVYDSVNNTVRLPKLTGITEGTTDLTALGDLVEAGLPNIVGTYNKSSGTSALVNAYGSDIVESGALYVSAKQERRLFEPQSNPTGAAVVGIGFDASRSNSIYGNSTTVQPKTIKVLFYIVIATVTKTDIQVDIDEIVTDLNSKVDISSPQTITGNKNFTGLLQHNGYSVDAVVASGSGYIRYESGLQICWGTAYGSNSGYGANTFPMPFVDNQASVTFTPETVTQTPSNHVSIQITGIISTGFGLYFSVGSQWVAFGGRYIAVGYWK